MVAAAPLRGVLVASCLVTGAVSFVGHAPLSFRPTTSGGPLVVRRGGLSGLSAGGVQAQLRPGGGSSNSEKSEYARRALFGASGPKHLPHDLSGSSSFVWPSREVGVARSMSSMKERDDVGVKGKEEEGSQYVTKKADIEAVTDYLDYETEVSKQPMSLWTARILFLIMACLCGSNFPTISLLEQTLEPSLVAALRFSLAGVVLIPLLKGLRKEAIWPGIEIGLWLALGYLGQGIGLKTADASTAAFICSLTIVVCPLLMMTEGRMVDRKSWFAAILAVCGVAFLELGDGASPSWNDLWTILQPLSFAMSFWRTEQAVEKHPDQVMPLTALQTLVISVGAIGWAAIEGIPDTASLTATLSQPMVLGALGWTALFGTSLILWGETVCLGLLSSAEAALLFSTEPLWSTMFAIPVLNEKPGMSTLVGGGVIMTAIMVRLFGPSEEPVKGVASETSE
mmetsp:Transcript_22921/g.56561  ORF Transcript_22921/g.56561 Transcript_22921/m.56561 type:complete len:454 (+) Transcript_22921:54-1415(+)